MEHRGRFQAQGVKLEKSKAWAQENELLLETGHELLKALESDLSKKDSLVRTKGFSQCRRTMDQAAKNGGIKVSDMGKPFIKSYPKGALERLDLEVRFGIAFVEKIK